MGLPIRATGAGRWGVGEDMDGTARQRKIPNSDTQEHEKPGLGGGTRSASSEPLWSVKDTKKVTGRILLARIRVKFFNNVQFFCFRVLYIFLTCCNVY